MKRSFKCLLIVFCLLLCLTALPEPVSALDGNAAEILSINWTEDQNANVGLSVSSDCQTVVALYTADERFLSLQTAKVSAGAKSVSVHFSEEVPDAAIIKAFLVDKSYQPLCDPYTITPHIYAWQVEDAEEMKTLHFSTIAPEEQDRLYWEVHPYTGDHEMYTDLPLWDQYNPNLTTVVFDTPIHPTSTAYWFAGRYGITTIQNIENLHTESVTDMKEMFQQCSALETLDVSAWNTSRVTNMEYLFGGCSSLKELDVSGWNTSRVTDMDYLFASCSALTSLDVSGWNTENVTSMKAMFSAYSGTEIAGIENLDTSHVTDMSEMFCDCYGLTSLDLSRWDVSNVTTMASMFRNDNVLERLNIEGWNTGHVADMSEMFQWCWNLAELDVSTWDTGNVTNMNSLFQGCQSLPSLDVSGWNTANVADMGNLFSGCQGLTALDISKWNTANVTDMSWLFQGCNALTELDVSRWDVSSAVNMRSMFQFCRSLQQLDVTGFETLQAADMSYLFSGCEALTALDVSGLETENVTDMRAMFGGCRALEHLDVSGFDTSKVTSMANMFSVCNQLKTITFGAFNTGSVTDMSQMFDGSYNLVSLDLSSFDTSKVENMEMMFCGCSYLRTLDLSSFDTANVSNMMEMFNGCRKLGTIYVSDTFVTKSGLKSIKMFSNCYELKGGGGTAYDSNYTTAFYAHIDDAIHNPGYFTDIAVTEDVYAVYNYQSSADVLSFYSILPADAHPDEPYVWKVKPYASEEEVPWKDIKDKIKTVTISQIISTGEMSGNIHPTSMAYWFSGCGNLEKVSYWGAEIDTSLVTDMRDLFKGCAKLKTIDLYGWDTSRVTDMTGMFSGCSSLETITVKARDYLGDGLFVTDYAAASGPVFDGCVNLKGQNGTAYDPAHVDVSYACVDDGYPGYLTEREREEE